MATPATIEAKFREYVAAFNSHDMARYSKYWAEDFHAQWPGCPPAHSKEKALEVIGGLSWFQETLHPTFMVCTDKVVAIENKMHVEVLKDIDFPFPFDGATYKKGDSFVYPIIVHYEYDDNLLMTTFRAFAQVVIGHPGEGIKQQVLPGFDPIPPTSRS
ncbi:MAG: hypothetical protein M1840_007082 [Geoglossum simile]|nr:MAG: hypothetical protein M1840_007082 [Geoglossum simile]